MRAAAHFLCEVSGSGTVRRANLPKSTVEQLVKMFVDLALDQYEAELDDNIAKYNRLFVEWHL